MGIIGVIAVVWLIYSIIKEQYEINNRNSKTNRKVREYEEEQCKRLGIEPFEERLKQIVEESKDRQNKE